jgi:NitT/TauT family transport system ATP-binding protein
MSGENVFIMKNVWKSFSSPMGDKPLTVLENITLKIDEGEIVALIGPSGCGKSTVLNIAAGFEEPDEGHLLFKGEPVIAPSSKRGVVFQSAVLFPWLTVKQNIVYGLKLKKLNHNLQDEKCEKYISLVGLKGFEHYYPHQLSGGMQQRVSITRVLIMEPKMLLMDEPFASLDAQTRISMQQLLLSISLQLNPSILFITHDVEEALFLADSIYVMSRLPGRIKHEIHVPFPKPRTISLLGNPSFSKAKHEILQLLFEQAIFINDRKNLCWSELTYSKPFGGRSFSCP